MMPHTVISEHVNIYQLPERCFVAADHSCITIGDLHGNAMKLMFMLIKQGIATEVSEQDYDRLVVIYRKNVDNITVDDLTEFNSILDKIKFNNHTALRLIGDELADRGSNDYFTLKILQALKNHEVSFEILLSNHGVEFLLACEDYPKNGRFHAPTLSVVHALSLVNLNKLVLRKLCDSEGKLVVTAEDILKIAREVYQPSLKAISYSLNEDRSEITLYSHAPIGLNTVKDLAKQFVVPYEDSTIIELFGTIDRINAQFKCMVNMGVLSTQCPQDKISDAYHERDIIDAPLVFTIWNRCYGKIHRPHQHQGYRLIYVHGHDKTAFKSEQPYVYNLDQDNTLGKLLDRFQGQYHVLSTATSFQEKECLQQRFRKGLEGIKLEADELRKDGYVQAADAADLLYTTIDKSYEDHFPQNMQQFTMEFKAAVAKARPCLEHYRCWDLIVSYFMLTVCVLGIPIVLVDMGHTLVTGEHCSFFQTYPAKQVSALEQTLDQYQDFCKYSCNNSTSSP